MRDYEIPIYLRYQNLLVVISVPMEDQFRQDQEEEAEEEKEESHVRSSAAWIHPSIHPG